MNKQKVVAHALRTVFDDMTAIALLNQAKLEIQALTLLYSSIDKMAWLNATKEESGGPEFKAWVDKFLLIDADGNCNADDLWAARCGLVHTGAAESRDFRATRANAIYYHSVRTGVTNAELLTMVAPLAAQLGVSVAQLRLVDHLWLFEEFGKAVERFHEYLSTLNEPQLSALHEKANRQLSFQALG